MTVVRYGLLGSLVVFVGLQSGCSGWFEDFGPVEQVSVSAPAVADKLALRGAYLARNVAACGNCHALQRDTPKKGHPKGVSVDTPLAGGLILEDRYGQVVVPNITPDSKTGIGRWSIAEVMRALRASIDRDGKPLSIDSHRDYRWMSDEDAKSIAVYLLQQRPVRAEWERRSLGAFEKNRLGIIPVHSEVEGYVPAMTKSENAGYGRYLARNIAQCSLCHGDNNLKSLSDIDSSSAQSIRPVSFAGGDLLSEDGPRLSQEEIVKYLTSGGKSLDRKSKGKRTSEMPLQRACPVEFYRGMSSEDIRAIALYLTKMQTL